MYIAKRHRLTDQDAIFSLVEAHPLGAWVCQAEGALVANHIPFFLDRTKGPLGVLVGHVARANPRAAATARSHFLGAMAELVRKRLASA